MDPKRIDWTNPNSRISTHFTVGEAIWLREWGRLANESDGLTEEVKANIVKFAREKMDRIRSIVDQAIFVKSWYRPKKYNVAIGGAEFSMHMTGLACDWWTDVDGDGDKDGADCDYLKDILYKRLEELDVRMENNGQGAKWIHIDSKKVTDGMNRYFKP